MGLHNKKRHRGHRGAPRYARDDSCSTERHALSLLGCHGGFVPCNGHAAVASHHHDGLRHHKVLANDDHRIRFVYDNVPEGMRTWAMEYNGGMQGVGGRMSPPCFARVWPSEGRLPHRPHAASRVNDGTPGFGGKSSTGWEMNAAKPQDEQFSCAAHTPCPPPHHHPAPHPARCHTWA